MPPFRHLKARHEVLSRLANKIKQITSQTRNQRARTLSVIKAVIDGSSENPEITKTLETEIDAVFCLGSVKIPKKLRGWSKSHDQIPVPQSPPEPIHINPEPAAEEQIQNFSNRIGDDDQCLEGQAKEPKKKTRKPEQNRKKTKKPRKNQEHGNSKAIPQPPDEIWDWFGKMGCDVQPAFVIKKPLTHSDTTQNHNRFSIPKGQIHKGFFDFLTTEENEKLENKQMIEVDLVDPCGRVSNQYLIRWELTTTYQYALRTNWYKEVVRKNEGVMKKDDLVQLWVSRRQTKLCFALVRDGV